MLRSTDVLASVVFALSFLTTTAAMATAQRTFVASSGNDANPCSLTQPCRSFAVAITQTSSGGEIIVLDSAGYGPVVVTQAVSIIAPPGVYAGISVPFVGVGVRVSAGAVDLIVLRGLTMTALPGAASGIQVLSAGSLVIEGCEITGRFDRGITAEASGDVDILIKGMHVNGADDAVLVAANRIKLTVIDSVFNDVIGGIGSIGDGAVVVDNVRLIGRGITLGSGIYLSADINGGSLHVSHTLVTEFNYGVFAEGTKPNVSITTSELNRTYTAVIINAAAGQVALTGNRLVHSTIMFNVLSGVVMSSGTNYAADNGSPGSPITGPGGLF